MVDNNVHWFFSIYRHLLLNPRRQYIRWLAARLFIRGHLLTRSSTHSQKARIFGNTQQTSTMNEIKRQDKIALDPLLMISGYSQLINTRHVQLHEHPRLRRPPAKRLQSHQRTKCKDDGIRVTRHYSEVHLTKATDSQLHADAQNPSQVKTPVGKQMEGC